MMHKQKSIDENCEGLNHNFLLLTQHNSDFEKVFIEHLVNATI